VFVGRRLSTSSERSPGGGTGATAPGGVEKMFTVHVE
jgi:hypothetical protein